MNTSHLGQFISSTTQVKNLNNKKTATAVKTGHVKKTTILEMPHEHNFHEKHKGCNVFESIAVKLKPLVRWLGGG